MKIKKYFLFFLCRNPESFRYVFYILASQSNGYFDKERRGPGALMRD